MSNKYRYKVIFFINFDSCKFETALDMPDKGDWNFQRAWQTVKEKLPDHIRQQQPERMVNPKSRPGFDIFLDNSCVTHIELIKLKI